MSELHGFSDELESVLKSKSALLERWAKNEVFVSEYGDTLRADRYAGLPTLYPKKLKKLGPSA